MKQPAHLIVRQKIELALRKKPTDSDRQIASSLNTSHVTVGKVRKTLKLRDPNAKRVGKDGIARSLPYTEGGEIPGLYGELWVYLQPNAPFSNLILRIGLEKTTKGERDQLRECLKFLKENIEKTLQRLA